MRILHIVEAYTVHVNRIVNDQTRRGHEVRVLTFDNSHGCGPCTVVGRRLAHSLPYGHHWGGLLTILSLARSFHPDIVHGHYLSTAALYLGVCSEFPTIGSAIGSDILIDTRAAHARLLVRCSGKWVDWFTSVAPHTTRRLVELGISPDRISTFPWGVDSELFHPVASPTSKPLIVSTRSFEPVYDVPTIVQAFKAIAMNDPDACLLLLGGGSQRPSLAETVNDSGLRSRVQIEGHLAQRAVAETLRKAAVYVSSAVSDGVSSSLLEAMATGLVPVVTDIEANREWVHDNDNGLLFRPGDSKDLARALAVALTDRDLADRALRKNPRIVIQRASWLASMQALDRAYQRAIT